MRLGLDDNISPRGDLGAKAERFVKEGKMTQAKLDRLRRQQGAHENGIEVFPFVVGALVMGVVGGVDAGTVNRYALFYTAVRVAYTLVYINNTTRGFAAVRSVLYWVGNITCIRKFTKSFFLRRILADIANKVFCGLLPSRLMRLRMFCSRGARIASCVVGSPLTISFIFL